MAQQRRDMAMNPQDKNKILARAKLRGLRILNKDMNPESMVYGLWEVEDIFPGPEGWRNVYGKAGRVR